MTALFQWFFLRGDLLLRLFPHCPQEVMHFLPACPPSFLTSPDSHATTFFTFIN